MRALLYDIHGNLPALEAVVEDARGAGATEFVLGGDYALAGAWPQETVKLLEKLDAGWIRGNTERWLEEPFDAPDSEFVHNLIEYCRDQLGHKRIDKLNRLPQTLELDGALVCHASPRDDMLTFMPEATEGDDALLSDADPEIIFFGHSHIQFSRETGTGRLLVNPGSVGLPFDGDRRAAYALWAGGREIELRRVAYDTDAYVAQVRERMGETLGPEVETLVREVGQATMVG